MKRSKRSSSSDRSFSREIRELPPESLAADPMNIRKEPKLDDEFMESIKKDVIEPLVVRPVDCVEDKKTREELRSKGRQFVVTAGVRRLEAAIQAELKAVPCIVRELSDLEEKSAKAMKRRQRMRRYEGAQTFVPPLFLPDTGELLLDTMHFVRLAHETPVLYRVSIERPSPELGKYLTTGKWSRHAKLEPADVSNYVPFVLDRLIETVEKADVPEPYRTRFEEFKSGLLARALQR